MKHLPSKAFSILLCVFLSLFGIQIYASTPADDLSQQLSSFHSMTAEFSQTLSDAKGKVMQKSSGTMALQRPGQFRWEVKSPNAQLLIADGNYLWVYDPDLAQATKQKMDKNNANSPASLLSGSLSSLQERFNVSMLSNGGFKLVPKNKEDMFQWIELHFTDSKLTRMRMRDNLGSLSEFQFTAIQINPPTLSNKLFQFNKPKGVEIIKN